MDELLGRSVSVHLNLTTHRWVLADKPKAKVLAYADNVTLRDVTFRVSEAQRQYCIAKKGRWVHAYALGTVVSFDALDTNDLLKITYNPFRAPTFHVYGKEWPVLRSTLVSFSGSYCYTRQDDLRDLAGEPN